MSSEENIDNTNNQNEAKTETIKEENKTNE